MSVPASSALSAFETVNEGPPVVQTGRPAGAPSLPATKTTIAAFEQTPGRELRRDIRNIYLLIYSRHSEQLNNLCL